MCSAILVLIVVLILPRSVLAVVTYDTFSTATNTAASSISWSHTVTGANPLLVCAVSTWISFASASVAITGFTYNSVAMTHKVQVDNIGNYTTIDVWYLAGAATGAHTVAVTFSGNPLDAITGGCISFAGVNQGAPLGTETTNTNGLSNTITIPSDGLGVDFGADAAAGCVSTWSATGPGQTKRFQACADNGGGATVPFFASTSNNSGSTGFDWASVLSAPTSGAIPVNAATAALRRGGGPVLLP